MVPKWVSHSPKRNESGVIAIAEPASKVDTTEKVSAFTRIPSSGNNALAPAPIILSHEHIPIVNTTSMAYNIFFKFILG